VTVYFEGRDLPTYGVFVKASELVVGHIYFKVSFVDDDTVIPELSPLVFVGRNLDADELGLYFQDVDSYLAGQRYEAVDWPSAPEAGDAPSADGTGTECSFTVMPETDTVSVCEYDRALDQLLACSLRRQKWDGEARPIRPRQRS
jgi:hypothetical protein